MYKRQGLDPALRADVRNSALKAVAEAGIPALLVTHDTNEAMENANHLAIMRKGTIIQTGSPEDVYMRPVDIETAAALGPTNLIHAGSSLSPLLGEGSVVREEGIQINNDGPVHGRIVSLKRTGTTHSVSIEIDGHGLLRGQIPNVLASIDEIVNVSFAPKFVIKF